MIQFLLLFSSLVYVPDQVVDRNCSLRLEVTRQQEESVIPMGMGEVEVDAEITYLSTDDGPQFSVVLQRIQVSGSFGEFSTYGELDTDEEASLPRRWWHLKRLRKAMDEPLIFILSEEGYPELIDSCERFETWPSIQSFITGALGEVLFSKEFILHDETEATFTKALTPLADEPIVQYTVDETPTTLTASYASDWSGRFTGRMEWERDNPLLYSHTGTDLFAVDVADAQVVTVLRHRITSTISD